MNELPGTNTSDDAIDSIEEDNERMIREAEENAKLRRCSFCGKDEHACGCLIAGQIAFICDECTQLCADITLKYLWDKAARLQNTIKDMEENGGIPAIAGISDQVIPEQKP